jgi:hypothetical protein
VITRDIGMVALGHGKYVRAADIVALIPIDDDQRGDGRRTYVYVAGLDGPIVASRSERAILADMERAPLASRDGAAPGARPGADGDNPPGGRARRWRRSGAASASSGRRG